MINVVDEVLSGEPLYRIVPITDSLGNTVYKIELVTSVTQAGTPLNKALFDSISTDILNVKNLIDKKILDYKVNTATQSVTINDLELKMNTWYMCFFDNPSDSHEHTGAVESFKLKLGDTDIISVSGDDDAAGYFLIYISKNTTTNKIFLNAIGTCVRGTATSFTVNINSRKLISTLPTTLTITAGTSEGIQGGATVQIYEKVGVPNENN